MRRLDFCESLSPLSAIGAKPHSVEVRLLLRLSAVRFGIALAI